jgi:low temperature requirement protein LtrA
MSAPRQASRPVVPLRVSTLELFFDLVFAFTLTQLTALLAHHFSAAGAAQVVLIFGVLWWMYGGYGWLTNTRIHDRPVERLLLLVGMAGFLAAGLAIPHGLGPGGTDSKLALGIGYLTVVVVHSVLFYRVNRNIVRITPFNVTSAALVIVAAFTPTAATYALWIVALAVQWLSPLIASPGGRFDIQPAHFAERHGALVLVALGESVAAIGIGAAPRGVTGTVAVSAVLGLALSAALWWVYFGDGDDDRAARVMAATDRAKRAGLALDTYYAHIPLLLGVVATATGITLTFASAGRPHRVGQAIALAGGVALFLAGSAWWRRALGTVPVLPRLAAAGFALATAGVGATVSAQAQVATLTAGLVVLLAAERRWFPAGFRSQPQPKDTTHDRALHPAGDGPHLERRVQVRALVQGRSARAGGTRGRWHRPGRRGGGGAGGSAAVAGRGDSGGGRHPA